ncbi:MAG: ABC transporter ATP-binding protein [Candidatus Dormibacteraceae bacterium]
MSGIPGSTPLLEVEGLEVSFRLEHHTVYAVQGLGFTLRAGERLGVVGESGSGKSVTALSILRMVPGPGRITGGTIRFQGRDLLTLPEQEVRHVRGAGIGMIPQNPLASLNPVLTVEAHFREVLARHLGLHAGDARERAIELLRQVGIPDPAARMREYPHRMSGGQRQRVMIALAIAAQPRLLIADEPTTALDVTIQAQILELFDGLVAQSDQAALLITHNLGIVAGHCDRVVVMYAGRVMEAATTDELFRSPAHPYTVGLLRSVPRVTRVRERTFHAIPGQPPQVTVRAAGCPFAPRCERATEQCHNETPPLAEVRRDHALACWHPITEPAGIAS